MITITGNYTAWELELERLAHMPDPKTIVELDAILSSQFAATQVAVHIETGSLKSSGKMTSAVDAEAHTWEGTMVYGGPSLGVNNPVDYAIYEKARGGPHDFLASAELLEVLYTTAIKDGLKP